MFETLCNAELISCFLEFCANVSDIWSKRVAVAAISQPAEDGSQVSCIQPEKWPVIEKPVTNRAIRSDFAYCAFSRIARDISGQMSRRNTVKSLAAPPMVSGYSRVLTKPRW